MAFLVQYILAALFGTFLVYCGIGLVRPPKKDAPAAAPTREEALRVAAEVAQSGGIPEAVPDAEPANWVAYEGAQDAPPPIPSAVPPPSADPPPPAAQETIVENVRGYTPSTEKIRSSGNGVQCWGVVVKDTDFYDKDGKHREDLLAGGTLVEQTATSRSSIGEMALCRVWRGSFWAGSYLISTANLLRFDGTRDKVDAEGVDLLCAYYKLNSELEKRKEVLVRRAVDANPHGAKLRAVVAKMKDMEKKSAELTKRANDATGAQRNRLLDQRRAIIAEKTAVEAEVRKLTAAYEEWKKTHNVPAADPANDTECQMIQKKMDSIRPELKAFGI